MTLNTTPTSQPAAGADAQADARGHAQLHDTTAADGPAVARVRLLGRTDQAITIGIRGTSYQITVRPTAPIAAEIGKRIRGVIRAPVWKLDRVSGGGGAYIEPVYGKPRRVQGYVIGATAEGNGVIVDVCEMPFIGELPDRWRAADLPVAAHVGLDLPEMPTFTPIA